MNLYLNDDQASELCLIMGKLDQRSTLTRLYAELKRTSRPTHHRLVDDTGRPVDYLRINKAAFQ